MSGSTMNAVICEQGELEVVEMATPEPGPGQVLLDVRGCGICGSDLHARQVVAMLKAEGVRTVVASDFSARRRALAYACGADVVVDPTEGSAYETGDHGWIRTVPDLVDLAIETMGKLRKLPVPWQHVFRIAERLGATNAKRPVIFECVGVPGILDGVIASAELYGRRKARKVVWPIWGRRASCSAT